MSNGSKIDRVAGGLVVGVIVVVCCSGIHWVYAICTCGLSTTTGYVWDSSVASDSGRKLLHYTALWVDWSSLRLF